LDIKERIKRITARAVAGNTTTSHDSDIKSFWAWAWITKAIKPHYPTRPDLIESYIIENVEGFDTDTDRLLVEFGYKARRGKLSVATIRRRVGSIMWKHADQNLDKPVISQPVKDLFRTAQKLEVKTGRTPKKSRPITVDILLKLLKSINGRTLIGKRNRAILVFGFFSGGRRRAEIAAAEMRFLKEHRGGYLYTLHRSKTDQAGQGLILPIWRKRAKPIKIWIKAAGITDGYLFRQIIQGRVSDRPISGQLVNNIVKDHIEDIGLDPSEYSAHGLRRGFVTECARRGMQIFNIMQLTGHRDMRTVQGYFEHGDVELNPCGRL